MTKQQKQEHEVIDFLEINAPDIIKLLRHHDRTELARITGKSHNNIAKMLKGTGGGIEGYKMVAKKTSKYLLKEYTKGLEVIKEYHSALQKF